MNETFSQRIGNEYVGREVKRGKKNTSKWFLQFFLFFLQKEEGSEGGTGGDSTLERLKKRYNSLQQMVGDLFLFPALKLSSSPLSSSFSLCSLLSPLLFLSPPLSLISRSLTLIYSHSHLHSPSLASSLLPSFLFPLSLLGCINGD